ncbi:18325_t:CDS:2, partial [Gigaspora rosea]
MQHQRARLSKSQLSKGNNFFSIFLVNVFNNFFGFLLWKRTSLWQLAQARAEKRLTKPKLTRNNRPERQNKLDALHDVQVAAPDADPLHEAGEMWRTGEPCKLGETGKISRLGEISKMMNWQKVAEYSETGELVENNEI